jgi:peptidoglycan/LPS O-acetylase OafA/YrhL
MKYRSDIDGLRCIAVFPVILFHLGYNWINGGYYGVDVFFVLSGFLITTIITKEIHTDSFSLKSFWLRRIKRILPAIISVVLITLIVGYFLIFRGDIISLTSDALSALFSYANIHLLLENGNYWGASAEKSFFLHAWSLSVEEQFYIFYPVFLFTLYKFKQSYAKWLIAVVFVSLAAYLIGSSYQPYATFYMLPSRAWELACGGLLAVTNTNKIKGNSKFNNFFSVLGLILILSSYFVFTGNQGVNFHTILPVLGTMMVITFSSENNIVGKFLSVKPIVYIGRISYSLYLWHWPIIVLLTNYYSNDFSPFQIQFLAVVLMIIFSIFSYKIIECKTRRWKHTPKLVICSLIITIGFIFFLRSPYTNKITISKFNKTEFYGLYYDITPTIRPVSEVNKAKREGIIAPKRDTKYNDAYKNGGIITSSLPGHPQVVVLGDSHGAMWGKLIDEITDSIRIKTSFYTSVGESPFFSLFEIDQLEKTKGYTHPQRVAYAKDFILNLKTWKPKLLIVSCKWNSMDNDILEKLESLAKFANKIGTSLLILNQPPQINTVGNKNCAQYLSYLGYKPKKGYQYIKNESNVEAANNKLKKRFSKYSNVFLLDIFSSFKQINDVSNSLIINGSNVLYYDDDHLSYQGTLLIKHKLELEILKFITDRK